MTKGLAWKKDSLRQNADEDNYSDDGSVYTAEPEDSSYQWEHDEDYMDTTSDYSPQEAEFQDAMDMESIEDDEWRPHGLETIEEEDEEQYSEMSTSPTNLTPPSALTELPPATPTTPYEAGTWQAVAEETTIDIEMEKEEPPRFEGSAWRTGAKIVDSDEDTPPRSPETPVSDGSAPFTPSREDLESVHDMAEEIEDLSIQEPRGWQPHAMEIDHLNIHSERPVLHIEIPQEDADYPTPHSSSASEASERRTTPSSELLWKDTNEEGSDEKDPDDMDTSSDIDQSTAAELEPEISREEQRWEEVQTQQLGQIEPHGEEAIRPNLSPGLSPLSPDHPLLAPPPLQGSKWYNNPLLYKPLDLSYHPPVYNKPCPQSETPESPS